jgi:hypothetical protein
MDDNCTICGKEINQSDLIDMDFCVDCWEGESP